MGYRVFVDGAEGTTGLQIFQRLKKHGGIELLEIESEKRKDAGCRAELMNLADIVFLCLPDAAAVEAVGMVTNSNTRIIDASTAHRTAPNWVYGFPEKSPVRRKDIANACLLYTSVPSDEAETLIESGKYTVFSEGGNISADADFAIVVVYGGLAG